MLIAKIYHSREDRVAALQEEEDRVQWQDFEQDAKKIEEAFETLDSYVDELADKVEDYVGELVEDDENSFAARNHARREMIETWALAQAALSKIAWVARIDGNEAYQRMVNALSSGDDVDMVGL